MDLTYDAVFGGTTIRQVKGTDFAQNVQKIVDRFSGGLDPQLISLLSAEPKVTVRTGNLGVLSAISASTGLAVTSAGTIVFPWQQRASGSTFTGSGTHYSLSATLGLIVPMSLSAQQDAQEGATLTLEFTAASSDGLTAPIAVNASVTLAAQAFVATHGLGPIKFGSTAISGVKSATVNFGLKVESNRYAGLPFATIGGIFLGERDPTLELEFEDKASAAAFAMFGTPTTVTAYFRKFADGSTRVANGTAEHIAATLTGGLYVLDSSSGSGTQNASNRYTVHAKSLSISTTAQIT